MSPLEPLFPQTGQFLQSIRDSCRALRVAANIKIERSSVERLLRSPAFTETFSRVSKAHGLAFPLQFPSVIAELNLLSTLSLLNFASGYRSVLHEQTGRGAWDNIRALVFSFYISSAAQSDADWLSARGMAQIGEQTVAEHMRVSVNVERPHETIPGVTVGDLGGPMHELVKLIKGTLNETGSILLKSGYPDLGTFVLGALKEGEKANTSAERGVDVEIVLESLVRALPGFRDMSLVNGQPVYVFKKALFLLHAINIRFGDSNPSGIPIPDTSALPVFADNVLPSLLIHLGVIDLSSAAASVSSLFAMNADALDSLLSAHVPAIGTNVVARLPREPPKDGPSLTEEQAYVLRAAAIDACETILDVARSLDGPEWIRSVTLPEIDLWLWAVAKDRPDYRHLERFVLRNTVMF